MAFSSTVDERPTAIGNMMLYTGTWNAASVDTGSIDLTGLLVEVLASGVMADAGGTQTGAGVDGAFVNHSAGAAGFTIECVQDMTGRWWALGRRS
tara:strand:- start:272 stop:556 length:285 start_codon:yes stop_codon:yes gene_type:complete